MNDALRMDDDVHTIHFDAEEPARFDHLQTLVEERGGIDGDFLAHHPGGMFERAFNGDFREFFFRRAAEWPSRSRKQQPPHRFDWLAIKTLENGGMLTVHRQHPYAMLRGFAHDDLTGHDQDFLGSDGDVFAGANSRQRGPQASGA